MIALANSILLEGVRELAEYLGPQFEDRDDAKRFAMLQKIKDAWVRDDDAARRSLSNAQYFSLDDRAAAAADQLATTARPSALLQGLRLVRPPYPVTWLEYHTAGLEHGFGGLDGWLIEEIDPGRWRASFFWRVSNSDGRYKIWGRSGGALGSPVAIEWTADGACLRTRDLLDPPFGCEQVLADKNAEIDQEWLLSIFTDKIDVRRVKLQEIWKRRLVAPGEWYLMPDQECEAEAALQNAFEIVRCPYREERSKALGDDPGTEAMLAEEIVYFSELVSGQFSFLRSALLFLNSPRVTDVTEIDISKLNKARARRGRPPYVSYKSVTVRLADKIAAHARGTNGGEAPGQPMRLHMVRGHFKVRRTGVFWWNSFVRGEMTAGEVRHSKYEVK